MSAYVVYVCVLLWLLLLLLERAAATSLARIPSDCLLVD